ncbi:MAG: SDR family NAD(P)-dependent oxidoreductase, partial [Polyangiales bacterium]
DVLINNAGVLVRGLVGDLSVAQFDEVMRVNVRGAFLCARAAFSRMIVGGHGGSIVNVASLSGVAGVEKFVGYSAYVASKFAVVGLTEALAVEGRAHGIRVNAVSPGAVDTAMLKQGDPSLKSNAKPEDVARSIVFLALDPLLTGANLPIFSNA